MRSLIALILSLFAYFYILVLINIERDKETKLHLIKQKIMSNIESYASSDIVKPDLCILFRPILGRYKKIEFYNQSEEYIKKEDKYVIFTVAFNYKLSDFSLFMNSLVKTTYNGDIFAFINADISDEIKEYLKKHNVYPLYISNTWPYYLSINTKYPISYSELKTIPTRVIDGYYKTSMTRYFVLNLFMKKYGSVYKYGMLVDLKDVSFQLNPFSWNIPDGISLFEESRAIPIGRNSANFYWIKKYFRSLYYFKKYYIVNGGQIYFTYPDIIYFLDEYNEIIRTAEHVDPEQAVFNIIYYIRNYTNRKITLFPNYFGPVRLMHSDVTYLVKDWKVTNNNIIFRELFDYRNNQIINCDGSVPLFVHFYFLGGMDNVKRIIEATT